MSILAEPKRKVRISVDPQNVNWKNDEDKFGKRLMEKMGWSDGQGLGKNLHGDSNNVKLKANHSGRGLGAKNTHDSNWIVAHDDFADILKSLNKNKKTEDESEEQAEERRKKVNMELASRSIKRRIHYQKFTRAKDLTQYSEKEKEAIFGQSGKKKIDNEEEKKDKKKESDESSDDTKDEESKTSQILTTSAVSVQDYFAAKMAALKAKRAETQIKSEVEDTDEKPIKKEEPTNYEDTTIKEEVLDEEDEEAVRIRRKKEKKERKRREREAAQLEEQEVKQEEIVEVVEETEKQRRKREKKERKMREREQAAHEAPVKRHYDEENEEVPSKKRRTEE